MLRYFVAAALLVVHAAAFAQSYAGSYIHQSQQGLVRLVLQQQGNTVTGTMTGTDGNVFQLQGALEGQGVAGNIRVGQETGFFALRFVNNQLKLIVAERDPGTGQPNLNSGWNLDFVPAAGAQAGIPHPGGPGTQQRPMQQPGTQAAGVERDPVLVGVWSHSNTYNSGDFSATTRLNMQINGDGTYLYGKGNVSLGGAYQGNTGRSGDVTAGQWRTQGGVVYVMEQGGSQWAPHARYYVEGSSLMFTFGNGNRQLWNRQ